MKDNYERDEKLSMCDDCINRFNWEKCNTCKHRKKFTQAPGTSPFPLWPNIEPYRTIPPLRYQSMNVQCNSQQAFNQQSPQSKTCRQSRVENVGSELGQKDYLHTPAVHNQIKKKGGKHG
jgi:hypothetical protein